MKRYIIPLCLLCASLLSVTTFHSCVGEEGTAFPLEFGNPVEMIKGTWRITSIYKGAQSSAITTSLRLPSGQQFHVGDLLSFGKQIAQSDLGGTFTLISTSGTVNLPWSFTQKVVPGVPYTGGISLAGFLFYIRCWTPERWIFYPDGGDDPWYIELEHDDDDDDDGDDDDDDPDSGGNTPTPTKPKDECDNLVSKIVKRRTFTHSDITTTEVTTYTFSYQSDDRPSSMTVSANNRSSITYTYSYGNGTVTLKSSEKGNIKTVKLSGGFASREDGVNLDLTAAVSQSSTHFAIYDGYCNSQNLYYQFGRSSNLSISTAIPRVSGNNIYNNWSGDWLYTFSQQPNNTNLCLNYFLTRLWEYDPGYLFPLGIFGFYGSPESYLINGASHYSGDNSGYNSGNIVMKSSDYKYTLNSCKKPEKITFTSTYGYNTYSISESYYYVVEIYY